jgi:cyclic pyranopterin phosphate synthase
VGEDETRKPGTLRDGWGRVIEYLRVSVTDRCNSRCFYCMPREGVPFIPTSRILRYEEILLIADVFLRLGIKKIRITGGEPLVRKNVLFLLEELRKKRDLRELVLTTNGMALAEHARALKRAGVARVNVSLDTLNRDTFRSVTGQDGLARVLDGIDAARDAGLPVKLNVVAMRGVNDREFSDFVAFGIARGLAVRFIELMPQRYNSGFARELFVSTGEILVALEREFRLSPMETCEGDAASGFYEVTMREAPARGMPETAAEPLAAPDGPEQLAGRSTASIVAGRSTVVGMISPLSEPFCRRCNRVRIMADGTLKTCLFGEGGPNLKEMLSGGASGAEIEAAIIEAVRAKPESLHTGSHRDTAMHMTGG